ITKDDNNIFSITAQVGDEVVTREIDPMQSQVTFDFEGGNQVQLNYNAGSLQEGTIGSVGLRTNTTDVNLHRTVSNAASSSGIVFQVGANGHADQRISFRANDMSAYGLGLHDIDISTVDGANNAMAAIEKAITTVAGERGTMGATQNRLEHTLNNLGVTHENLYQAESTIRDADMAKEIMNWTQKSLQAQASQAMMAQGMNMTRQNIMSLLMF
ncbi:MAG: hypothetical protein LBV27_02795, partial [Oscillospiraceae bacterium]|nr:hypothetical protein [Oscillospiraceae bacterium]